LKALGAKDANDVRVEAVEFRTRAIKGWLVAMAWPAGEVSRGTTVSGLKIFCLPGKSRE